MRDTPRRPTLKQQWDERNPKKGGPDQNAFSDTATEILTNTAKIAPVVAPQLTGAAVGVGATLGAGFVIYQGSKAVGGSMPNGL